MICGWASPPMAPTRCVSAPSAPVTSMGERVCGGRRPGATSAGWPGTSEKPTPRLCRKTPVAGSTRCDPKSSALDCVSETPRPSASCAHRCVVSPSPRRATSGGGRCRWRRRATSGGATSVCVHRGPRRRPGARDRGARRRRRRRRASPGRSWPTARQRLDEQVGPLRIVRIGPEAGRLGHHGPGQRQVALRRRRHGPQVVAPGAGAQRRAPGRRAGGEVGRARSDRRRARAGPARTRPRRSRRGRGGRWRAACGRCPGSRTVWPMASGPSGQSSPAPGRACTRWLASASMMDAGKPSSASSIAGASTSSSGSRP